MQIPKMFLLDVIDCSANEDNSDEFISPNSTDSEYDTRKDPILFSQKHLNDLIREYVFLRKRQSSLHQG